jgi:hypothetical protein
LPSYTYGHNRRGELDVWTTRGETGTAFVRQMTIDGVAGPLRQSPYGTACFFLMEKTTGRYFFLEKDARGFYLHSEDFFGAKTYFRAEAVKVEAWLAYQSATQSPKSGRSLQDQ